MRGPRADAVRHWRARARPRRDRRELDLRQPALHRGPRAAARAGPAGGRGHRPLRRPRPDDRGRPGGRRADPAARRRQRRGGARGGPGRRRNRPRRAGAGLAGGARPPTAHGGAAGRRRGLRQPPAAAPRRGAGRRRHGAHRRRAGPAPLPVPVLAGARGLDPLGRRLRPRAPPAHGPRRPHRLRGDRRAARRRGGDRRGRAARRARGPRLPREHQAPLRAAAELPGGAADRRRRDLLLQPDLRAGHDGRGGRGRRAPRVPGGRPARPGAAVLRRRRGAGRPRVDPVRPAPTWRCRRWPRPARAG